GFRESPVQDHEFPVGDWELDSGTANSGAGTGNSRAASGTRGVSAGLAAALLPLLVLTHPFGVADPLHLVDRYGTPLAELERRVGAGDSATGPLPVVCDENDGRLGHVGTRLDVGFDAVPLGRPLLEVRRVLPARSADRARLALAAQRVENAHVNYLR